MTLRLILLTLAAALTFVACPTTTPEPSSPPPQTGSPAPPTPPTPQPGDTTAPTVVSVSPNNAANGVEANAKIRIEFSEPMNQSATEAAYQSADMPSVTFAWSPNGRRLEIDPVGDLELTNVGRVYNFTIQNTAKDLAGNALAQLTSRFRTFRELKRTLTSVGSLDGNTRADGVFDANDDTIGVGDGVTPSPLIDVQFKGFFSFDLTTLEAEGLTIPQRITAVKLRIFQTNTAISPYTDLQLSGKHLLAAHVDYGPTLDPSDSTSAILHDLGEISSDATPGYKTTSNALESVRDDWEQRVARGNRSQFMLFFPLAKNDDGFTDLAIFNAGEALTDQPKLEVTFLVP